MYNRLYKIKFYQKISKNTFIPPYIFVSETLLKYEERNISLSKNLTDKLNLTDFN